MIDSLKKFNRDVSLERFISHSSNKEVNLTESLESGKEIRNKWLCAILWGNNDIKGVITVEFTTLNILAMCSHIFENTKDSMLFEITKDFMKEYCNFYAGYIKGVFNNEKIDISLSLPILSNNLSVSACLGGSDEGVIEDKWTLKSGENSFEVKSYVKIEDSLKQYDMSFLDQNKKEDNKSSIEFF
ncbi:MAG: CheY-specific phosphatase CheX [Bacteriovoracaceae bacterium]|jgi:CheY-specific phosphatase CheX